ncbi:hypothetical protein [Methylibium petroleiphilum]
MMTLYALASIAASAAGWAVALASFAVISGMSLRESRWLTLAGWMCTGAAGVMLGLDPTHYITLANWPMAIMPISLAMVVWGHLPAIREHSQQPARHRVAGPIVAAALLAGCMVVPALAQTVTTKGTYTAVPAPPAWEYRAGAGTGALLAGPFETLDLCNDAAEAAAAKADAAKDTKATCRPAGGNVAITFVAKPPVVVPPVVVPPAVTWVVVGPEKANYTLAGRYKVRFGTGTGVWAVRVIEGSFSCGTTLFGDPAPGAAKRCERESATTSEAVTAPSVEPPVVVPPVVVPPVVTPPVVVPPAAGGVPKREDFASYPLVGQITATAGQVIERVRITTTSGPCVIVAAPNVTIRDALIGPCGPGEAGKGIDGRSGLSNLVVQRTYFEDVSSALYVNGGQHPITFDRNACTKIRGPMPRGQCVQFNNVKGAASSKITCNVADVQGQPNAYRNVEDWFNFYSTGQVEVAYNRIRGGGYQGYNGNNPSGTAILFGDAQGGTGLWAHDNVIVNVTNVGIGVAGSVGARVENNRIYMNGPASGNFTNIGIYVATYSQGACSGHRVAGNRAWVRKNDGSPNHYWTSGSCGPVDTGGTANPNVWDDASLDPVAMFNTVPTQCQ